MDKHTSFRVGGPADWFVIPETPEELAGVVAKCRRAGADWYVIGNGSNLLVSDGGFRGVIICTGRLDRLEIDGNRIIAGAGLSLAKLAGEACRAGLAGLEFASGIPGSVGGAAVMNAGAYGSEMKDVLTEVTVLDTDGTVRTLGADELELGYRTSAAMKYGLLILEAVFGLDPGDPASIRGRMEELAARRKAKQPLEFPSAGSTFKRPAGYFAGTLIESAGLKGCSEGGASVSEKHAGFVINRDHATAADILNLCHRVQKRVQEHAGVLLEMEVRLLGEFTKE